MVCMNIQSNINILPYISSRVCPQPIAGGMSSQLVFFVHVYAGNQKTLYEVSIKRKLAVYEFNACLFGI